MFQYKTLYFKKLHTSRKKIRHFDKKKSVLPEGILQCQGHPFGEESLGPSPKGCLWHGAVLQKKTAHLDKKSRYSDKKMRTFRRDPFGAGEKIRTPGEKVHTQEKKCALSERSLWGRRKNTYSRRKSPYSRKKTRTFRRIPLGQEKKCALRQKKFPKGSLWGHTSRKKMRTLVKKLHTSAKKQHTPTKKIPEGPRDSFPKAQRTPSENSFPKVPGTPPQRDALPKESFGLALEDPFGADWHGSNLNLPKKS